MSVLNQSGEEQVECPLCMEPLEVDDLNFYPCTCGYQICRFCWHRIRTDENGLCPACRKAYSENPADFTPLSKEQVAQLKAEKRARDQQRKAKLSESRKHLAAVRVVQKNLVFVVGLPVRLADADVLKRHEYFGKFGKIHKVVINQSTSYAGSQGPSASAYVTYVKSDDALRAIQSVNNIMLDGRLIKSSLGTTKYCSHFMKNQPCPKADCMYLHDFGDPEASFTKEQMHVGKHQEYEKKLHDSLQTRTQQQQALAQAQQQQQQSQQLQQQQQQSQNTAGGPAADRAADKPADNKDKDKGHKGKDANWPTLHGDTNSGFGNKTEKQQKSDSKSEKSQKKNNQKNKNNNNNTNSTNNNIENSKQKSEKEKTNSSKNCEQNSCSHQQHPQQHQVQVTTQSPPNNTSQSPPTPPEVPTTQPIITPAPSSPLETSKQKEPHVVEPTTSTTECLENLSKMQLIDDNSSFFSHNSFQKILPEDSTSFSNDSSSGATPHSNILNDNLPDITSSEDWQAAFGFSTHHKPEPIPNTTTRQIITENGFQPLRSENGFANHLENYQIIKNNRETILDVLAGRNSHFNERLNPYANLNNKPENGLINGLDQQMSKFFAEFNNKNGFNHQTNGFVADRPNFLGNQLNLNENQQHNNMLLLNYQQRLEDQALYNLKQNVFHSQQQQQQQQQQQHNNQQYLHNHGTPMHHSGAQFLANGGEHYLSQNGQSFGNSGFTQNSVFQNQTLQQRNLQQQLRGGDRASVDDDLGFDPFHETQKALAELIESEQGVQQIQNNGLLGPSSGGAATGNGSVAGSAGGPVNGLLAGGASQPHLPPPPGFMQHNTHMNSFGSKILPFLNMSSSQQISTSGGWSTNYSEAQLKGLAPVNDWMTLDPAIVSSSRHFPLANLPLRDQFPPSLFQQSQNRGAPFDYPPSHTGHTNGYSQPQNPHIPAYANGYTHHTPANGLNWFAGDLQGVSSPPGFRPASKTQEC